MTSIIDTLMVLYSRIRVRWLRADPLLMGAAIAYNTLFALVPLAIAFVSIVSLFEFSSEAIERLREVIVAAFPPDVSSFLLSIVDQSLSFVTDDQGIVLILSIAVALWSGSRAVYAVQKALRLVEDIEDDRGYLRNRAIGILVTIGAGISVMVMYTLLLFGEAVWEQVASYTGLPSALAAVLLVTLGVVVWVFGLIWVVYRYGPPDPVPHTTAVATVVGVIVILGSWLASSLIPRLGLSTLAVFGALGIILIWLYFIGVTVIGAPIVLGPALDELARIRRRYPRENDDAEHLEDPRSP